MENRFFVIYPKARYDETNKIMQDIADRLGIDYQLWSYSDVNDEYDYYQSVVEPSIEKAEFVLVFLANGSENEYLVSESVRFSSNLNKSVVPIKLKNSDLKEKDWNFRSKILDYYDEGQRIKIVEQMHGWLGLVSKGDVYGSKVVISTDCGKCVISRDNEVLGSTDANGNYNCIFAKGSRSIEIKSDSCWNRYVYSVPDNNSELHFEATISGVRKLSKMDSSMFRFNPDNGDIPRWDITNRSDFVLVASSEDKKKKDIIYNSFDRYYRSKIKPYPEFIPKEIVHSNAALAIFWIFAIALVVIGIFVAKSASCVISGIVVIIAFFIIRRIKDNAIRKMNEHRRRELIDETNSYNYDAWHDANERMNYEFKLQNLPPMDLPQLSAPNNNGESTIIDNGTGGGGNDLSNNPNPPKSASAIFVGLISVILAFIVIVQGKRIYIFLAIISLILSLVAISKSKKASTSYYDAPERYKGTGILKAGKIISIAGLVLSIISMVLMFR